MSTTVIQIKIQPEVLPMMRYFFLPVVMLLVLPALGKGMDPNTVGLWHFEEGQGNKVADSSGNGHDGEATDGAKWIPDGKFGKAMEFDGVSSYVEIPASDKLDLIEFTVELWFRAESIDGTRAVLGHGESFDTDKAQYIIELNDAQNPNKVQVWYEAENDDDTYVGSTTDIALGVWYFFAATRDENGTINVYLDGELEATTEQPVPPAFIDHIVTIGCRTNEPNVYQDYFHGAVDEVRISNVARSEAEIRGSFQSGFLAVTPGCRLASTWGWLKQTSRRGTL